MSAPDAAVLARGLVRRYGEVEAVAGLDLEIAEGEFFGLLGPNGSGKTTTIHMLSTLVKPGGGSARVAGFDVASRPVEVRARIGLVFQESALDRTLSVAENLRFAGALHGLAGGEADHRASALLELFGMAEKLNAPVGALSGGQRRAVDIIRGVLHEPRVLFLDEPTIGLDLPVRRRIWRFIEGLRARNRMTVLLTTHYLEEADACDRVAFVRRGRLVSQGTPRALVDGLGRHVVEFESERPDELMARAEPLLGRGLKEGPLALYRWPHEETAPLARLQDELGPLASAMRVRRPNLGDVFLWVHAGEAPAAAGGPREAA
jgi:ABC-2 type transport system ATP-binding protein